MIKYYSTHCPVCKLIQSMLDKSGLDYEMIDDEITVLQVADQYGIKTSPFAIIDDKEYLASDLKKYIYEHKEQ